MAAAREELASRERSIQAKASTLEAKAKDRARMILAERETQAAQLAAMQARADAAEAAMRELQISTSTLRVEQSRLPAEQHAS